MFPGINFWKIIDFIADRWPCWNELYFPVIFLAFALLAGQITGISLKVMNSGKKRSLKLLDPALSRINSVTISARTVLRGNRGPPAVQFPFMHGAASMVAVSVRMLPAEHCTELHQAGKNDTDGSGFAISCAPPIQNPSDRPNPLPRTSTQKMTKNIREPGVFVYFS